MRENRTTALRLLIGGALVALPAMVVQAGGFIGLGAAYGPDYEGSNDYKALPALFGHYAWESGRYVNLGAAGGAEKAIRLSANLLTAGSGVTWEAGPLLQYRLERNDVDDDKVDDMKNVDAATEAGAFVGMKVDRWSVSLAFAADVSDKYNGYLGYLKGGYSLPVNDKLKLGLGAHLTYADSNYMQQYFGVKKKDAARSGLKRYSADNGLKDWGLSVTANYAFNKSWGLMGVVGYTRLMNDAEDSPLVSDRGDENQVTSLLAITYSF